MVYTQQLAMDEPQNKQNDRIVVLTGEKVMSASMQRFPYSSKVLRYRNTPLDWTDQQLPIDISTDGGTLIFDRVTRGACIITNFDILDMQHKNIRALSFCPSAHNIATFNHIVSELTAQYEIISVRRVVDYEKRDSPDREYTCPVNGVIIMYGYRGVFPTASEHSDTMCPVLDVHAHTVTGRDNIIVTNMNISMLNEVTHEYSSYMVPPTSPFYLCAHIKKINSTNHIYIVKDAVSEGKEKFIKEQVINNHMISFTPMEDNCICTRTESCLALNGYGIVHYNTLSFRHNISKEFTNRNRNTTSNIYCNYNKCEWTVMELKIMLTSALGNVMYSPIRIDDIDNQFKQVGREVELGHENKTPLLKYLGFKKSGKFAQRHNFYRPKDKLFSHQVTTISPIMALCFGMTYIILFVLLFNICFS